MLGPMDEYPVHQIAKPIAWPGSSDRNFYDRSYFNAHDRTGEIMVISGLGHYPNLGTKDAFILVARNGKQTAVHLSDLIDQDRLNPHVGSFRIERRQRHFGSSHDPRPNSLPSPGCACNAYSAYWWISFATMPVQPVWWLAPSPSPVSPWKYS